MGLMGMVAGVVLGGIVATAGCEGADDDIGPERQAELRSGFRFHHRHGGPDAGTVGGGVGGAAGAGGAAGTTGRGGAVADDCDVCTQAQQCCEVAAPGDPVCTFNAAKCSSMQGDARPAYVNACLTFLVAARGARANPPAECR
jgi:hypothetical protein